MGRMAVNRISLMNKSVRRGTLSRAGRPVAAGVAAVASIGLLAACGDDAANSADGNVNTAAETTSVESTDDNADANAEGNANADGAGNAGTDSDGDATYAGWDTMDAAISGLATQDINCEIPEIDGLDEALPFAVCAPDGMLAFDLTVADFEEVMAQDATQGEEITLVSDENWIFACDSTESAVCDDVAEYTGGEIQTLGNSG